MDSLNFAEKGAVEAALEVAAMLDVHNQTKAKEALKDFKKGALTKDELLTAIACVAVSLKAMTDGDDPDRSSSLNKKKIAVVSLALALNKLKEML